MDSCHEIMSWHGPGDALLRNGTTMFWLSATMSFHYGIRKLLRKLHADLIPCSSSSSSSSSSWQQLAAALPGQSVSGPEDRCPPLPRWSRSPLIYMIHYTHVYTLLFVVVIVVGVHTCCHDHTHMSRACGAWAPVLSALSCTAAHHEVRSTIESAARKKAPTPLPAAPERKQPHKQSEYQDPAWRCDFENNKVVIHVAKICRCYSLQEILLDKATSKRTPPQPSSMLMARQREAMCRWARSPHLSTSSKAEQVWLDWKLGQMVGHSCFLTVYAHAHADRRLLGAARVLQRVRPIEEDGVHHALEELAARVVFLLRLSLYYTILY